MEKRNNDGSRQAGPFLHFAKHSLILSTIIIRSSYGRLDLNKSSHGFSLQCLLEAQRLHFVTFAGEEVRTWKTATKLGAQSLPVIVAIIRSRRRHPLWRDIGVHGPIANSRNKTVTWRVSFTRRICASRKPNVAFRGDRVVSYGVVTLN